MKYEVLGPVRAVSADGPVEIGGERQQRLLAALLHARGQPISVDALVEVVFVEEPPSGAIGTLRTYVARLRRSLDAAEIAAGEALITQRGGYRLTSSDLAVDSMRFESSVKSARSLYEAGDPLGAIDEFRSAETLWRGEAFGTFASEAHFRPEAVRLAELRSNAREDLHQALLDAGLVREVVESTRVLVAEYPLRERLRQQQAIALYRAGRQSEALRSLDAFRAELAEVGLEASSELAALEGAIASHDPSLRATSKTGRALRGYRVGSQIGEGRHAVVYRAVQPGVGRDVAMKTIRPELADDPSFVRAFDAEAQLVSRLEHPDIVPIHDYWREPGAAYIVMRLFRGTLAERLADGPLPLDLIGHGAQRLGGALAFAHQASVVHGDIKPSNILMDEAHLYLADFGVASLIEDDEPRSPSSAYRSPELAKGSPVSEAADQFAFAAVLYLMLTGTLPFGVGGAVSEHEEIPSVHALRPSVPAAVHEVLAVAMAWSPDDRYGSVQEFTDAFALALTGSVERPSAAALVNPYRGLHAFTEADRHLFFGRSESIAGVVDLLASEERRPVVVFGASGAGKSSVVHAGVVPSIRRGAVPGSDEWVIASMRPGGAPFGELESAIRAVAMGSEGLSGPELAPTVRGIVGKAGLADHTVLLVIDQMEELFTQVEHRHEAERFLDELAEAVEADDLRLRLLVTLRADYMDRPLQHRGFGPMLRTGLFPLPAMTADQLESAITGPARHAGVEIEPAFVSRLIVDIAHEPSALPLLQFVLSEVFDKRRASILLLDDYLELGGLAGAIANRAEEAFTALSAEQAHAARRLFLHLVATDARGGVGKRRVVRSDLRSAEVAIVDDLVDLFGAARLLTFDRDPDSREPTVEIAHEALLDQWPRLQRWVADSVETLRLRSQITEATERWAASGENEADLLRGLRLDAASELLASDPDVLSNEEQQYVQAAEEARAAAVGAEHRTNRRLRRLLTGVGVLAVVALIAGAVAASQSRSARSALAEAEIATLISRSAATAGEDPEISVLLALEAHRRKSSSETEQAVLSALGSNRIPNRVATGSLIDTGDCPTPTFFDVGVTTSYGVVDGTIRSLDLATGIETEIATTPGFSCGVYLAEPSIEWTIVANADALTYWLGTADDPYVSELSFDEPHYLLASDLTTGVATFVTTVGGMESIRFLDVGTGEFLGEQFETEGFISAAVNGAGTLAAVSHIVRSTAVPARLDLIDLGSGDITATLESPTRLLSMVFDDRTGELLAATDDSTLISVDTATGRVVSEIPLASSTDSFDLAIRPDSSVIVASQDQIEVVDRATGESKQSVAVNNALGALVRPDGSVLVIAGDGTYRIIELEGNALASQSWSVNPTAKTSFNAGQVSIIDPQTTQGSILDLATGRQTELDLVRNGQPFIAETIYPEENGLWGIAFDGIVARFESGVVVEEFDLQGQVFTGTRFGDYWAVLATDGDPAAFSTGEFVAHLTSLEPGAGGVVFTVPAPNGFSVHPGFDGGLHVFDEAGTMFTYDSEGNQVSEIETGRPFAFLNAMDPTTGVLAIASEESGVTVIKPDTLELIDVPGDDSVANLGLGRDGELLMITRFDGSIRAWDLVANRSAGLVFEGDGARLSSPSYYDAAADSMWFYTSGRILEIPLDPAVWIERACSVVGRELSEQEWRRFVPGSGDPVAACPERS